uniref:Reverse transcriptase domain-containing protein n=1 Tax=Cuerna arida TaxID=1464854 RepID=A0A1B6F9W8_9HEMI
MEEIKFGVPQGSVLGATLFLIYNDHCNASLNGSVISFADDTALSYTGDTWEEVSTKMNEDLLSIQWWFCQNNMMLSVEKTKYINFMLRGSNRMENKVVLKCNMFS